MLKKFSKNKEEFFKAVEKTDYIVMYFQDAYDTYQFLPLNKKEFLYRLKWMDKTFKFPTVFRIEDFSFEIHYGSLDSMIHIVVQDIYFVQPAALKKRGGII